MTKITVDLTDDERSAFAHLLESKRYIGGPLGDASDKFHEAMGTCPVCNGQMGYASIVGWAHVADGRAECPWGELEHKPDDLGLAPGRWEMHHGRWVRIPDRPPEPTFAWVEQVITIDAIDPAASATIENEGWQLLHVGMGSGGQTTLTFGWPAPAISAGAASLNELNAALQRTTWINGETTVSSHTADDGSVLWSWKCHECSTADAPFTDPQDTIERALLHHNECPRT